MTRRVPERYRGCDPGGRRYPPQRSDHHSVGRQRAQRRLCRQLPSSIAVKVSALFDKDGAHGVKLGDLPDGFAGVLRSQTAVCDLTGEAIIHSSRELALQALLVDPVEDNVCAAKELPDTMLVLQNQHLGHLR